LLYLDRYLGLNKKWWQIAFVETALALLASIGLSALSYRYFEGPFLRLKSRFSAEAVPEAVALGRRRVRS
jgi:peptidoglycan/LPS O-acetylase OafA/YrhL